MWDHKRIAEQTLKIVIYTHVVYKAILAFRDDHRVCIENIIYLIFLNSKYSFLENIEKFILLTLFNHYNTKEALIIKYHCINDIGCISLFQNIILLEIDFQKHIDALVCTLDYHTLMFSIILLPLCLALQYYIKNWNKNYRRKLFHIFLMIYFWNNNPTKQLLSVYLIIFLLYSNNLSIYKTFLRPNEMQTLVLPHVVLLASFVYTSNLTNYRMYLITMCILDSCASIPGTLMLSKSRTVSGSVFGVLCAIIVHLIMIKNTKIGYYVICGAVEYYCHFNDNLALPYLSLMILR